MPEYTQMQMYAPYKQETFPLTIKHFEGWLRSLRYAHPSFHEWLAHIASSIDSDDGAIYLVPSLVTVKNTDEIMCAGVEIARYMDTRTALHERSWVAFNLLFDAEMIRERETSYYQPDIGRLLWSLLCTAPFREQGVYVTDEAQENQTWSFLLQQGGEQWAFDLAWIPSPLSQSFQSLPQAYEQRQWSQGIGLMRRDRWRMAPWEEG